MKNIERKEFKEIIKFLDRDEIISLKGARQTGKTTLLKEIKSFLEGKGEQVFFIDADDLDNKKFFLSPGFFISYLEQYLDFEKKIFLFIDEFQNIENAGLFLKNIFDKYKGKIKILVSGSSSLEITKNTEFLTGRVFEFLIYPISFDEYFFYNRKIKNKKFFLDEKKILENGKNFSKEFKNLENFYELNKNFLEEDLIKYLSFGGYPAILSEKNFEIKKEILKNITKIYIEKDIINFLKIEKIDGFNSLLKILSSQIGNLVNKQEISNIVNLSKDTVYKYLDILKGTFILDFVKPFSKNVRNEVSKMPKVFFEDLGIRNFLIGENEIIEKKIDLGNLVENFVYQSLRKKYDKQKIFFYRNKSGSEIDFIIEKSFEKLFLIEVKYRNKISVPLIFKKFEGKYGAEKKIILTKDLLKNDGDIFYIPVCLFDFIEI